MPLVVRATFVHTWRRSPGAGFVSDLIAVNAVGPGRHRLDSRQRAGTKTREKYGRQTAYAPSQRCSIRHELPPCFNYQTGE